MKDCQRSCSPWVRVFSPVGYLFSVQVFAALLLVPCAALYAKDKSAVPPWVKEAASQTLPRYPARTNAVVLLYDVQYSVDASGWAVEHVREVVKILRPQAGKEYGEVGASFRKDSKLNYMHAWSIGADGHEYAVDDKQMHDYGVIGGGELYNDYQYRSVTVPAADAGATVALEFERESHPYFTDYIFEMQRSIPVRKQRLTLTMPQGFTYKAAWKGEHTVKPVDLERGRTLWEMEDVPPIDLYETSMSPSHRSLEGRLDVHYSGPGLEASTGGDWKGIGQWYGVLAAGRNDANDAIRQKATALVAGKTDFAERAQAVAEYVQHDIRYVAIEIGVGGFQPHAASDIFAHSYGDCKDKATLLSAMLSAVGIRSTWVMVDTHRGAISPDDPSVAANHMIGAIELPKEYHSPMLYSVVTAESGKRFLIFDPTWDKTPFGQLESNLQGSYGLLMDGAESQIIQLPVLKPEQNLLRRTATLRLEESGELKGTVRQSESGDIASNLRELYSSGTAKQQSDYMNYMVAHDLGNVQVSDVKVENVASLLKDLNISYSIAAQNFSQTMGGLVMLRPRVMGSEGLRIDREPRTVPVNLGSTRMVQDDYEIELPQGYAVDEVPPAVKLDLGFASYESASEFKDGKLHYKRTFAVRDVTLPASRYDDLRKLAHVIDADEQGTAILKRAK